MRMISVNRSLLKLWINVSKFSQIKKCLDSSKLIKDVPVQSELGERRFAVLPAGFGKSIIFQLFPCVVKALQSCECEQ